MKGVSVLISAYQTQEYIEECILSITNQTYFLNNSNYEIIVGIDGCHKTLDVMKKIKNKYSNLKVYMMEKNSGTYITMNTLIGLSKYDNIIRFDSDDIMKPFMVETILNEKEGDIIQFQCDFYHKGEIVEKQNDNFANGVILCKRSVYEELGGYQAWPCSADTELLHRAKMAGIKICKIPKKLFYYRQHEKSLTNKIRGVQRLKYGGKIKEINTLKIDRVENSSYYEI
jgi:glycosyltransferase involved in cell wall biosynthesis